MWCFTVCELDFRITCLSFVVCKLYLNEAVNLGGKKKGKKEKVICPVPDIVRTHTFWKGFTAPKPGVEKAASHSVSLVHAVGDLDSRKLLDWHESSTLFILY